MAKLLKAFSRGVKAAASANGPGRFKVAGKVLHCPVCQHDHFAKGSALLNTVGMTLFNLDWANKSATTLLCINCGRIEWFAKDPTRTS